MYVLPWVLFVIGLLLIIIFTPRAVKGLSPQGETTQAVLVSQPQAVAEDVVLDYLQSLEDEIVALKGELSNLGDRVEEKSLKEEFVPQYKEVTAFQKILEEKKEPSPQLETYKAVYQAHDQGKSVTEIAKDLGKGKGEIELILGLRR